MNNKRILNYRPLVYILISVILSVLLAYFYLDCKLQNKFNFVVIIYVLILLLIVAGTIIFAVFKIKKKNCSFYYRAMVVLIFFFLSTVISFVSFNRYLCFENYNNKEILLSGYVENTDSSYIRIENVKFEYNNKTQKINVPVVVYNNSDSFKFAEGDFIKLVGKVSFNYSSVNKFSLIDLISQAEYQIDITDDNIIEHKAQNKTIKNTIKIKVENLLNSSMGENYSKIANATLFGDSHKIDSEITNMFSYAGISHLLAISGLHIGILVSVLLFLLKKTKLNKYFSFALIFLFLLLYSYFCSFSPSVLRASLMFLIFYFADIMGLKNDKLNSWCLVGIILLLINPLNIFDAGFQLSFTCIFALFLLNKQIVNLFLKLKFGKIISNIISPSISITLLTLPIVSTVFNRVSFLGIISNIFVLPIFSLMYLISFVCLIICCCLPFMSFLLIIPEFMIHLIVRVCEFISAINFGVFNIFASGYLCLFFAIVGIWLYNYLIVSNKTKAIVCVPILILSVVCFVLNVLPKDYSNKNVVAPFKQYSTNAVVAISDNRVVLIGNVDYASNLQKFLNKNKIKNVDDFYITDFEHNKTNEYLNLVKKFNVKNVYLPVKYANCGVLDFNKCEINIIEENEINDIKIYPFYSYDDELCGLKLECGNRVVLCSHHKDKNKVINFLSSVEGPVDSIYLHKEDFKMEDYFDFGNAKVYYIDKIYDNSSMSYFVYNNYI